MRGERTRFSNAKKNLGHKTTKTPPITSDKSDNHRYTKTGELPTLNQKPTESRGTLTKRTLLDSKIWKNKEVII